MSLPIPEVWHVVGFVTLPNGAAFNQGLIKAFDVHAGTERWLGENGFESNGHYVITYSKWNFQQGDASRTAPDLVVRIYDYQNRILWESNLILGAPSELTLNINLDDGHTVPENWMVSGTVNDADGIALGAGEVIVYDLFQEWKYLLGRSPIGSGGSFVVTYSKESFQRGDSSRTAPNLAFEILNTQGTVLDSQELGHVPSTDEVVALTLPRAPTPVTSNHVFGTLTNRLGLPLSGKFVSANCLDFQNDQGFRIIPLGGNASSAKGKYNIGYDPALLPRPISDESTECGSDKVAIYVEFAVTRINSVGAYYQTTISSPLVFNAKREQQIDLVFDEESTSVTSEYTDRDAVLAKYLAVVLQEFLVHPGTGSNPDIPYTDAEKIAEFLANGTRLALVVGRECLDEASVRAYFLCHQIALQFAAEFTAVGRDSKNFVEFFYGLVRVGSAVSRTELLALLPTQVHELLITAISKQIISSTSNIDDFLAVWKQVLQGTERFATDTEFGMYQILVLALHGSLDPANPPDAATKAKIQTLLGKFFDAAGDSRSFLALVEPPPRGTGDILDAAQWQKLAFLVDLVDFGEHYSDFVVAAFTFCQALPAGPRALSGMLDLAAADWAQIAAAASVLFCSRSHDPAGTLPPDFPGANPAEQQAIYARKLSKAIVSWFAQNDVVDGLVDLLANRATVAAFDPAGWQAVATFLKGDGKDYDLETTHLDTYLAQHSGLILPPAVQAALRALQRVYRVTTDAKSIAYLLAAQPPLDAAHLIAQTDEDQFLADHCVALGGMDKARQIHRLASHYTAEFAIQVAKFHGALNLEGTTALAVSRGLTAQGRQSSPAGVATNAAKPRTPARVVANWTNLFGALNQQKVSKGQSILSPSAYFVDLLEFLRGDVLDLLLSRRPDLLDLQLTQANAETPLPTIDLAVELLEALAANLPLAARQTSAEAADLRAEPEYPDTHVEAYQNLASVYYPHSLPVNFPREEARLVLEKLDSGWRQLALALDPGHRRHLVVDTALEQALTGSVAAWTLWGLDELDNSLLRPDKATLETGSWNQVLSAAAIFLDRSGLSMQQLLDLLDTQTFAASGVAIEADALGFQEGDINRFRLAGLDAPFARDASRFLRLMRLLDWTMAEMDQAWGHDLDTLDVVQDLHTSFAKPVLEVLAWGQPLQDALFETTFKPSQKDEALRAVYQTIAGGGTATLDRDVFGRWMGARLGYSRVDLESALAELGIGATDTSWNRGILENLFRFQSLSRTLRRSIPDFLNLVHWFGLTRGASGWSWSDCRSFCEKAATLDASPISRSVWLELATAPPAAKRTTARTFLAGLAQTLDALRLASKLPDPINPPTVDYLVTAVDRCLDILNLEGADKIERLAVPDPALAPEAIADLTRWTQGLFVQEILDQPTVDLVVAAYAQGTPVARLRPLLDALASAVASRLDDAIAAATETELVAHFAIPQEICHALLNQWLASVAAAAAPAWNDWSGLATVSIEQAVPAYVRLDKASILVKSLEIESVDQLADWMPGGASGVAFPSWNLFPVGNQPDLAWASLRPLVVVVGLLESLGFKSEGYLALADRALLSTKFDLRSAELEALLRECDLVQSGAPDPAPIVLSDPDDWHRFVMVLALFQKCHAMPSLLRDLLHVVPAGGLALYTREVAQLREGLMANMTPQSWREFVQPISDGLRKRRRDALAGYVCWRSQKDAGYPREFFDSNDLYAYYLLDVQMEPDMSVSRILQALLSIQQLVQRGFLGLEGKFTLSDKQKAQWEWMKNYRVWEANRKVFLYAENWIEAELRDDKSPFFKELEDSLLKSDDNGDSRQSALADYLEKMKDISSLEVVGACKEDGPGDGILYTLHVVGRSRGTPHVFYHRRFLAKAIYTGEWTPWEKIDAEIPGLIVIPVLLNKRLHLAWPLYLQSQEQSTPPSGSPGSGGSANLGSTDHQSKVEIRMEWIHFDGKKWSGKKTSKSALFDVAKNPAEHQLGEGETIGDRFHFQSLEGSSDFLQIKVFHTRYTYSETTSKIDVVVNSSTKVNQSKTTRTYARDNQLIGEFGTFHIWADGRDEAYRSKTVYASFEFEFPFLSVPFFRLHPIRIDITEVPTRNYPPVRSKLVHNYWIEDPAAGGSAADAEKFIFPKDVVLNTTPGQFRVLPVNFSFYSGEKLPFFFMDDQRTYFVQEVAREGGGGKAFKFELMSHPLVDEFGKRLRDGGLDWLHTRETQALPVADSYYYSYAYYNYYFSVYLGYCIAGDWQAWDLGQNLFESRYLPAPGMVAKPFPDPIVDFSWGSSNGIYNWELFFHIPMLLAGKMSQELQYQNAMAWYHRVFDPRIDLTSYERTKRWAMALPKGSRFWQFLPFFANPDADESISETLGLPTQQNLRPDQAALQSLVDKWKNDPFNPHLIARHRPAAYQKYVVMKYLDNLLAWADQLFRTDTSESINEAVQLYILAAEILGPRSAEVPDLVDKVPLSAREVLARNADALGNVLVDLEDQMIATHARLKSVPLRPLPGQTTQLLSLSSSMFYFAIPRNDKLLAYWDTVADRLYKIRNSLNFEGIKRVLALYAPPIDPGLLVRAKAAGLDIGAVLSGANAPLPLYRFQVMLQKAVEIARDVQSLGATLLATLEKKDAEALALMRTANEEELLKLNQTIRSLQIDEANKQLEILQKNRDTTQARYEFYRDIEKISTGELTHAILVGSGDVLQIAAGVTKLVAGGTALIPEFHLGAVINAFGGPQFSSTITGGSKISKVSDSISDALQIGAQVLHSAGTLVQIASGYERRWADWKLQENLANKELASIDQQILAAQIRIDLATTESNNLRRQIEQVDEVYTFMSSRFTNQELYQWLATQLGVLHATSFQLALDMAKRAERCYRFELGLDATNDPGAIVQSNQWDGLHKGLLAGERLLSDLRRLDTSFLERNRRELEITKPISLALLSPPALRKLQKDGNCQIDVPEALFDLDFPGHYFRRIKAVRLEIPCTAGPYTSVSAKLDLLENKLRTTSTLGGLGYLDVEYLENRVGIQSIATSQAQNDAGMFELNFRDERYLPFEGAGAISKWRLELPETYRQFDYASIADVVLHISYTARNGGERLANAAKASLSDALDAYLTLSTASPGLVSEVRLGRDFNQHLQQLRAGLPTTFALDARNFPAFVAGAGNLKEVAIYATPLPGKSINGLRLSVGLQDPGGATNPLDGAAASPAVTDSSVPIWQWAPADPGPGLSGSWTLATAAGASVLPALGEIVVELRFFPANQE